MSESTGPESTDRSSPEPLAAADQLPPVEPPSAGFIVQLFLIPMLIVGIIVVVWLMFSWLAQMGNRPVELVNDLERLNHASWQQALTLGKALQDPNNVEFARNPKLAKRLAEVLEKHIDDGHLDRDHVWLRMYLCMALGEFESLNGMPILIEAAGIEREPAELDVRRAAIWAMGRLAKRNSAAEVLEYEGVMDAIDRAATETGNVDDEQQRSRLRSTAAYVLGWFPNDETGDKLLRMTYDAHPDVRYNAAVSLARQGDVRAVETLSEMLDPANTESTRFEEAANQQWKRQDVMLQAVRAAGLLAKQNPTADLTPLSKSIQEVATAKNIGKGLRLQAKETLELLGAAP